MVAADRGGFRADERAVLAAILCLAIAVGFWTGSRYPDLGEKAAMGGTTILEDPLGFEAARPVGETDGFASRVYDTTRAIPPGKTRTYGEIAAAIGERDGARAVGQALGRNPFAIVVPCHRVVGANAKLIGFSASGGIATKLKLLKLEGWSADEQLLFEELA